MANSNKHQNKKHPEIKCGHSSCVVKFTRRLERRLYVLEEHGPLICCCIPDCKWTTRRMERLRTHLNNAHYSGANTDRTLPSEFRTVTAQSLPASSTHFSTPGANIEPNIAHTSPFLHIDYAFGPQAHQSLPGAPESYTAFNNKEAPHSQYNATSGLSLASSATAQVTPCRVFRPCRVRRRTLRTTARTSSTSPRLAPRGSTMKLTHRFYTNEQDDASAFTKRMLNPFNVELVANFSALYV